MKLSIPKDLAGFAYDRVTPLDLNSFDVDLLLPALFFKVVSRGQGVGRMVNDPTAITEYARRFAMHVDVRGFDMDASGVRLADRLARTAFIQIGRIGTRKDSEQIQGVLGNTLLSFKPGFRAGGSLRNVDSLLYRMLCNQLQGEDEVLAFFKEVFGQGLELRTGAVPDGHYDGVTELDALTRLTLAYLDGFEPTGVRRYLERPSSDAIPMVSGLLARDLRRYLTTYHRLMPIQSLTHHFKALINFELFVYSSKLFVAVARLVEDCADLPVAMQPNAAASPPQIYADFVGRASGQNREMSAACVRRDLEAIRRFIPANLALRHLDRIVSRLRGDRRVGEIVSGTLGDLVGPEYLQALLSLRFHPVVSLRIDAAAQHHEDEIRELNASSSAVDRDEELRTIDDELDQIAATAQTDFDRLIALLTEAQQTKIGQNTIRWYWSVGGLQKPHGILSGHLKSRQGWRYAPSNDLLATLVQLAAVDIPKWDEDNPRPRPIKLRDFLIWLEERFGIIVDRPPEGFQGAEYVAAAQENLRAMLRRLRQMGVFRDLSDDFTVQRLTPPYVSEAEVEEALPV